MKRILGATAALTVLAGAAQAENWDMPTAYADSNFHSENAKLFAEAVGICTGGDLTITVHAGGSLFGGADIKRAVQTGQAMIGERLISAHQNEDPLFGIDSIPFLATSFAASDRLWDASKDKISELMDSQNLVLLYSVPWPPQGLYVNKDIESLADLEGLKFRSYNAATAKLAELGKMLPVQVEAAELSQALATGVAEAFISSGSTGYDRKVWEHLSHFYDAQAWLPRNYVFVNKDAWDGLDEETQDCLESSAMMAQKTGTLTSELLTNWYLQALSDAGMTVGAPGDQLSADLAAIGETMTAEWVETAGPDGAAIIEAYKAAQ